MSTLSRPSSPRTVEMRSLPGIATFYRPDAEDYAPSSQRPTLPASSSYPSSSHAHAHARAHAHAYKTKLSTSPYGAYAQAHPRAHVRRASSPPLMDDDQDQDYAPLQRSTSAPYDSTHPHYARDMRRVNSMGRVFDDVRDGATPMGTSPTQGQGQSRPVRTSRYLREADRRNILERIKNGEKQADLAKEYQVSRAAISNLKQRRRLKETQEELDKVRHAVISHASVANAQFNARRGRPELGHGLALGSPVEAAATVSAAALAFRHSPVSSPAYGSPLLRGPHPCESRSASMQLLLSRLRRHDVPSTAFRVLVHRIFRLLLEEAMGLLPTRSSKIALDGNVARSVCVGVDLAKPACAIALTDRAMPMMKEFQAMEPASATGYISTRAGVDGMPEIVVCAPQNLGSSSVLLLDTNCPESGRDILSAIEAIIEAGASARDIMVVTMFGHANGIDCVRRLFPEVQMLTAQVMTGPAGATQDLVDAVQDRLLQAASPQTSPMMRMAAMHVL